MVCYINSDSYRFLIREGSSFQNKNFTAIHLKEYQDVQVGDWVEIARGKAKRVFMQVLQDKENSLQIDPSKVIYLPCAGKKQELLSEMETARHIQEALIDSAGESNIATHLQRVPDTEHVMVEAQAAISDLDDYIQKNLSRDSSLPTEVMDLGTQLIHGVSQLHQAGYVSGDLKLENALVFQEEDRMVVRISDFGKAVKVEAKPLLYEGNSRYAAPENVLTIKAEVYGTGLMLVRLLEEACIDKAFIEGIAHLPKHTGSLEGSQETGRRGIEGIAIAHGAPIGRSFRGALDKLKAYAKARMGVRSITTESKDRNALIREYVEKIVAPHVKKTWSFVDSVFVDQLMELILEMLRLHPEERPDMETVEQRCRAIFSDIASCERKMLEAAQAEGLSHIEGHRFPRHSPQAICAFSSPMEELETPKSFNEDSGIVFRVKEMVHSWAHWCKALMEKWAKKH